MVLNEFGPGTLVDWSGIISGAVAQVPAMDVDFLTNVPPADDSTTFAGPQGVLDGSGGNENLDGDGSGQGMLTSAASGRRISSKIRGRSLTLGFRVRVSAAEEVAKSFHDGVWLHFRLIAVRDPVNNLIAGWAPAIKDCCPMPRFSYCANDYVEVSKMDKVKYRVLLRGKIYLKYVSDVPNTKFVTRTCKYDKLLEYAIASQNGTEYVKDKIFLVFRSDCPAGVVPQAGDNPMDQFKPEVSAFTLLRYTDL